MEVFFHRFRVNGRVIRVDHGDYHAGKGVGYARLDAGNGREICVFITHTIAQYDVPDIYHPDRTAQLWDMAQLVRMTTQHRPSLLLVIGDMNCASNSVEMRALLGMTGLQDAYSVANEGAEGYTIQDVTVDGKRKRIDYVLFKEGSKEGCCYALDSCSIVFKHDKFFYSDHLGVEATFSLGADPTNSKFDNLATATLDPNTLEIIQAGLKDAQKRRQMHLLRAFLVLVLILLTKGLDLMLPFGVLLPLWVLLVLEVCIGVVVVSNDIAAFKQIHKEMLCFNRQT